MQKYEKINETTIRVIKDGRNTCFPVSPGNLDYEEMLVALEAGTAELLPIPPEVVHWKDKRQARIADGGYGTIREQLEMIGEGDASTIASYQTHIAAVKVRFPKV